MPVTLLQIVDLSISFARKSLIYNFSTLVYLGQRIALLGRNGSGKSTLLKIIAGAEDEFSGKISRSDNIKITLVHQEIAPVLESGGEALIHELQRAFQFSPAILLLDEPTNQLDSTNRDYLDRLIDNFQGTLIVATHDEDFIEKNFDTLWIIKDGVIEIFKGRYSDYLGKSALERDNILSNLKEIKKSKTSLHQALMKEQERAKKSKEYGKKKYSEDKLTARSAQDRGQETLSKNHALISKERNNLLDRLEHTKAPKILLPAFYLTPRFNSGEVLSISNGSVRYKSSDKAVRNGIFLSLRAGEKLQMEGKNGCGKSTLLKAIMNDASIERTGEWYVTKDCFYFDQSYSSLAAEKTVIETIEACCDWPSNEEKRKFLAEFLFMTNDEVENKVKNLSGGEKARLCLAQVACKRPGLILLDEVSNNLDIETKSHLIDVLAGYKGAMIIVSHDMNFTNQLMADIIYSF